MRIDTLIVGLVCLTIGFLGGYFFDSTAPQVTPQAQQQGGAAPSKIDQQKQIADLEQLLSREPDNYRAWVALGNAYYDTDQPMKSAEAYDRALALNDKDPNVIVDQGTMYRRLGWFDKAIANFDRALSIDPNHQQALYNSGVVYRYDLNEFKQAAKKWRKLLELAPNAPGSDQLKKEVEFLETHEHIQPKAE